MGKRMRAVLLAVVIALVALVGLAIWQPGAANAAGTAPQSANSTIQYNASLSGQLVDTYLGTDDQGYSLHYVTITANLTPQSGDPPVQVHLYLSEAFFPGTNAQEQEDVIPGGGQVSAAGILRGSGNITNSGGTINLYDANVSGLVLADSSMHFDIEGAGTGKAIGGTASLYLTINSPTGPTLSGKSTGTLDIPQAALELITSTDPLVGPTVWYFLRASGLAALLLLSATVLIGLALRVRLWRQTLERWRIYDVHLTISILTAIFLGLHLLLVLLDRIVPFSLADVLIPLHDSYQPIWIAAGIIGMYLLLVVWGSSLIRAQLGYKLWRSLHPLALAALGLVMLHALFAGTDGPTLWLRGLLIIIALAVIWLIDAWLRLRTVEAEQQRRKRGGSRRPQPQQQFEPRLGWDESSFAPAPRPPAQQTGPRQASGAPPARPRRISQE